MNERIFWQQLGIDPVYVALALFACSGNHELGCEIISAWRERA